MPRPPGKLPIHAYFFPTNKDLGGLLNGFYRYGQRQSDLHLVGGFNEPDSLVLEEYKVPTMDVAARTGYLYLQFRADGSLRGTWRAAGGGPRLPVVLYPVAGPGPATCAPTRLVPHANRWPTLATPNKQAAAVFASSLAAELSLTEADPGTQECRVTDVGHNLVSVWLTSEMRGAGISRAPLEHLRCLHRPGTHRVGRAGPHRLSAFLEEASIRLRHQLEDYITERGPQGSDPLLSEEDVAGLRTQEFTLDYEQFKLENGQAVFPQQVYYEGLSGFLSRSMPVGSGPRFPLPICSPSCGLPAPCTVGAAGATHCQAFTPAPTRQAHRREAIKKAPPWQGFYAY